MSGRCPYARNRETSCRVEAGATRHVSAADSMPNDPQDGQVYRKPRSWDDRIRSAAAPHNGQFAGSGSMVLSTVWIYSVSIANRQRNGSARCVMYAQCMVRLQSPWEPRMALFTAVCGSSGKHSFAERRSMTVRTVSGRTQSESGAPVLTLGPLSSADGRLHIRTPTARRARTALPAAEWPRLRTLSAVGNHLCSMVHL